MATRTSFTFDFEGQRYVVKMTDITGLEAKAYRAAVGMSPMSVFSHPNENLDTDTIAGLVWLMARRVNRALTYEYVAERVTFETLMTGFDADADADAGETDEVDTFEVDDPEA